MEKSILILKSACRDTHFNELNNMSKYLILLLLFANFVMVVRGCGQCASLSLQNFNLEDSELVITSPHCSTRYTPAELMFSRPIRTLLQQVREEQEPQRWEPQQAKEAITNMKENQQRQITQKGGRKREFMVGESVMTRDYREVNKKHWVEAKIEKKIGKNVYLCRLPTQHLWKRHSNQIVRKQSTSIVSSKTYEKQTIDRRISIPQNIQRGKISLNAKPTFSNIDNDTHNIPDKNRQTDIVNANNSTSSVCNTSLNNCFTGEPEKDNREVPSAVHVETDEDAPLHSSEKVELQNSSCEQQKETQRDGPGVSGSIIYKCVYNKHQKQTETQPEDVEVAPSRRSKRTTSSRTPLRFKDFVID